MLDARLPRVDSRGIMRKGDMRAGRRARAGTASARLRLPAGERRIPGAVDDHESPAPAHRSDPMRLAAEVERLDREPAGARPRMPELEPRAETDPPPDVPNRRGFERELKRSLAHTKRYGTSAALLYLDLDGFKAVNDRHGHAAGDAVLKAVA